MCCCGIHGRDYRFEDVGQFTIPVFAQQAKCIFYCDGTEKNEEAYTKLIQFLDDKSLSLVMRETSDKRREGLRKLYDHYIGKEEPRIISLYMELMSLKNDCNETVTDCIIRTETTLMILRNSGEI